jgi:hypothetical protein
MLFGLLNTKEKELVIPRPDYEQSGYALTPDSPLIKLADGSSVLTDGEYDYGVKYSTSDKIFANKLTKLQIQQRLDSVYDTPNTNTSSTLDLTPHIYLEEINFRSPFLNADNIKLPEIVVPFVGMISSDGVSGYGGQNSLTGTLDLRPLNVNGMFGGDFSLINDKPDLSDIIIPTACTRPIINFLIVSRSNAHTL